MPIASTPFVIKQEGPNLILLYAKVLSLILSTNELLTETLLYLIFLLN